MVDSIQRLPTISPVTGYDPERPFYGPVFLDGLQRASQTHGAARPDWSSNRLVLDIQAEHIEHPEPLLIYILDSKNHLRFLRLEGRFPGAMKKLIRQVQRISGLNHLIPLGNPLSYRITASDRPGVVQEQSVFLFRTEEELPPGYFHTLDEYRVLATHPTYQLKNPLDRLQIRIEAHYLFSRYGGLKLGPPDLGYSPMAAMQAFQRLHPTGPDREATIRFTPIVVSPMLALATGASLVLIKDDSEQRTGSFKERGARNRFEVEVQLRMAQTGKTEEEVRAAMAVVAFSHGNHGQGVAMIGAAHSLLVLPLSAQTQKVKIRNCLAQGSMVFLYGNKLETAEKCCRDIAENGLGSFLPSVAYLSGDATDADIDVMIFQNKPVILYGHPDKTTEMSVILAKPRSFPESPLLIETYDDPPVSVGQGTDAQELIGWFPFLLQGAWTYVIPVGGAGKIAGDGTVLKRGNPDVRVVGINRRGLPWFYRSVKTGQVTRPEVDVDAPHEETMADGIDVPRIGLFTTAQAIKIRAEGGLVTEDEVAEALVYAVTQPWYQGQTKQIEGAPAAMLAAVLNGAVKDIAGKPLVLSVSGKNSDKETMDRAWDQKGWVAQYPDFYTLVCNVRREIRKKYDDGEEANIEVEVFNGLLNSPIVRGEWLSYTLQRILARVEEEMQRQILHDRASISGSVPASATFQSGTAGAMVMGITPSPSTNDDTPRAFSGPAVDAIHRGSHMVYLTNGSAARQAELVFSPQIEGEAEPLRTDTPKALKLNGILVGNFGRKKLMTRYGVSPLHFGQPLSNRPLGRLLSFTP